MNTKDILTKNRPAFEEALEFYKKEIGTIRTGRATPALVEDVLVDYYGQMLHIKELAAISTPEPRTLMISPWDKGAIEAISGAIGKSDLAIQPIVDGQIIRITIPALTEERRKEFIKILKKKTEESRIKIRQIREHIQNEIQKLEKNGEISEDEKFQGKDNLQKIVDEYNQKIEDLEKKKESELMS